MFSALPVLSRLLSYYEHAYPRPLGASSNSQLSGGRVKACHPARKLFLVRSLTVCPWENLMRFHRLAIAAWFVLPISATSWAQSAKNSPDVPLPYCVVDSGHRNVFSDRGQLLQAPKPGEPFFGQDGQYQSHPFRYELSSDGKTVYDKNTGLTWQSSPDTDGDGVLTRRDKLTWAQAQARPAALNAARFGGYNDWRLPTIKELYSLINFRGMDPSGYSGSDTSGLIPFIDTKYFKFAYGLDHAASGSSTRSTPPAPCTSTRAGGATANSSASTSPMAGSRATT